MVQQRALVLGGRGDIGGAIANRLAASGLDVTVTGRHDFDLGRPDEIADFLASNGASYSVLVHSAGVNVPNTFEDLSPDDIETSLAVNLHGFLHVARQCLPFWKQQRRGRIVVISSLYGFLGRRGRLPYVMSKHALNGAVRTLAIEWGRLGVLINSVTPGYVATRMTNANNAPEVIAALVDGIPMGRLGRPEDIAEVVAFLASEHNTYVTGQDVVVDGGFSAGGFQQ